MQNIEPKMEETDKKANYQAAPQINLNYISCRKGGSHEGQKLNTVCLQYGCQLYSLCCCACTQQRHNGHKIKTLKTILNETNQIILKNSQQNLDQQVKTLNQQNPIQFSSINEKISKCEKQTFESLNKIKKSIEKSLHQIQTNLSDYFKELKNNLSVPQYKTSPVQEVKKYYQTVATTTSNEELQESLLHLLKLLKNIDSQGILVSNENSSSSIVDFIEKDLNQHSSIISGKLFKLSEIIKNDSDQFKTGSLNLKSFLHTKPLYCFDKKISCETLKIEQGNKIISSDGDMTYQMGLMNPSLNMNVNTNEPSVFRFKINKSARNWVGVGMAHRKVAQQNNFIFDYNYTGHGAYMISANGGSWSHTTPQFNNKVKAFKFNQGDIICCVVNNQSKTISFIKQRPLQSIQQKKRQFYQLSFTPINDDPLHPCVTIFYLGDKVQYMPFTNICKIPNYQYVFSETMKHADVVIRDKIFISAKGENSYKACILNNQLTSGGYPYTRKFSFRIVRSEYDWIAVGMCHKCIVQQNSFGFDYENTSHGCYMVSANGGSWSCLQQDNNNVVKSFNFSQGDVVQCTVYFEGIESEQNKIVFKLQDQEYQLRFKINSNDKLYPCVVLHYKGDQVAVMPSY